MDKKLKIAELQAMILEAEGFLPPMENSRQLNMLGPMAEAFPTGIFPMGAIHEFVSMDVAQVAASAGFISCLIGQLMQHRGPCLWVSMGKRLFPPALKRFGMEPDRVIFVNLAQQKDTLWVIEEALKCPSLAVVVGEIRDLDLTASRRLQLAVEQSRVTGLLHRYRPGRMNNMGCAARWQVRPMASKPIGRLPGIGYPTWQVELQKVRNGRPGCWQVAWHRNRFEYLEQLAPREQIRIKTGT